MSKQRCIWILFQFQSNVCSFITDYSDVYVADGLCEVADDGWWKKARLLLIRIKEEMKNASLAKS